MKRLKKILTTDEAKPEGDMIRKRGRPRKNPQMTDMEDTKVQKLPKQPDKLIIDTSFAEISMTDSDKTNVEIEFMTKIHLNEMNLIQYIMHCWLKLTQIR